MLYMRLPHSTISTGAQSTIVQSPSSAPADPADMPLSTRCPVPAPDDPADEIAPDDELAPDDPVDELVPDDPADELALIVVTRVGWAHHDRWSLMSMATHRISR